MNGTDSLYAMAATLIPALGRVMARAERGRELTPWGLNPHRADPGTSMARDDDDGYEEKIPEGLTGTVLYPVMNAVDALAAIKVLMEEAATKPPFNHHMPSFLSLCRTAIECSAQAIWVMSPEDRDTRRARATGLAKVGIQHAIEYHDSLIKAHEQKLRELPDAILNSSRHRSKFHRDELAVLESLPQENGRKYSDLVRKAANWIEDHPPLHTEETNGIHWPTLAKLEYRVSSSFVHGHSWPIDLLSDPLNVFSMMADCLAAALISTESAVCLYEAQSTIPANPRPRSYPERLQVTIDEWRLRYTEAELGQSPITEYPDLV